jgi:TonB family protein
MTFYHKHSSTKLRRRHRDWIIIIAVAIMLHAAFLLFFKTSYLDFLKTDIPGDEGSSPFPSMDRPFTLIPYPEPEREVTKGAITEKEPESTEPLIVVEDDFGSPPTELMPIESGSSGGRDGARGQRKITVEPKPLFIPWPKYPKGVDDDVEGSVELLLFVNRDGIVEDVKVTRALPYEALNAIAMESARKIRFTPGREKGVPTSMWVRLTIGFQPR